MQLKELVFYNRAPFEEIRLTFDNNAIAVLTAINGKGKTTILSYLMDSWVEMTRDVFTKTYEGKETSFYRVSSSLYTLEESKPSIVYIRYEHKGIYYDYVDVRNMLSAEDYENIINFSAKISYDVIKEQLKHSNVAKVKDSKLTVDIVKEIFNNQVCIYMPSYRSETPNYLNDNYVFVPKYKTDGQWSNEMINPLEVSTGFVGLTNWFMDLLLDRYINQNKRSIGNGQFIDNTPESQVWRNVLNLLREALSSKYPRKNVRFGIARRNNSVKRISIMNTETDRELCPSIFSLSTGEQAILMMFGEIIRQGDRYRANIPLIDISGIVLIDEIDKHLHMKLQKEILPKLMQLLPNVQFIVSSHSPFFNMGLADINSGRALIFDLDNDGISSEPTNNAVYNEAYNLFLNDSQNYANLYKSLKEQVAVMTRPLVITEGKTDIKLIIKAFEKLGIEVPFDIMPAEKQPNGCSELDTLITQVSNIWQVHKIIGIFDSDVDKYVSKYGTKGKWNKNNVYAFCIPTPQSRADNGQNTISIEYLFSDEEIHSTLPNGTQLYFGNEFETTSRRRHIKDRSLMLSMPDGCGKDKIVENNGGQAVYRDGDDTNLLAKKDAFADAIFNDQIVISMESWENFHAIIDIILSILGG